MSNFKRLRILEFLQWNDRHGCYTDENCDLEGVERLNEQDAVKFFFGVMNEDFYYSKVDNIFELTYEEAIDYAKQNDFYDCTVKKLERLLQEPSPTDDFYRGLI